MSADVDLSELSVVDAHCHSYLETPQVLTGDEFARCASIAVQPNFLHGKFAPSGTRILASEDRLREMYRQQPFFKYMIHLLSQFFHCEPEIEAVAAKRSARTQDFDSYVKELFEDTRILGLVMDGGYPLLTDRDIGRFPATVVKIFRLETSIKNLLVQHDTFDELTFAYESRIRGAIKKEGYAGLKSIIAYRTGLKIRRIDLTDAKNDFLDLKSGHAEIAWFGPKVKRLRDFLFVRALELSIELDVPMQVHTGVGDYDIVLDQCDPALMYDLLKDEQLRHAKVVLVHSGFPNNQNAAYIASVLPNVFLDFSLTIPFLNPIGHERLIEILELAPSSKIMYGSDGFNLPELIWLGAKVGKRTLGRCLSILVKDGLVDEDDARRFGRQILFENANDLYGLGLK